MSLAQQYLQLIRSNPNLRRFLDVIGWAEGADYNVGFGGRRFSSYSWHPYSQRQFRITDPVTGRSSTTSAAGKYQYQRGTWDSVAGQLGLRDFSPVSQDIGAVHLIAQRGQLQNVLSGNFPAAVIGLRGEWQSFVTRPLNSILRRLSLTNDSAPNNSIGAVAASAPAFNTNISIIGERNRYLLAFAILVIIFVFAFN